MKIRTARWAIICLVVSGMACEEVQPAQPSDELQTPWEFSIEFALEDYGDEGEYIARARLYNALDALDPVGNAGKSLRLSDGDEVYADGVHLDIETRTPFLDRESFDYSAAVPRGKTDYLFEFRRPDETIAATIPNPPDFEVSEIGEREFTRGLTTLEWTPLEDERWISENHPSHGTHRRTYVNMSLEVLTDDCVTLLDGNPTVSLGQSNMNDTGTARVALENYHSPDHDCEYDIIFERSSVRSVPGTWTTDEFEVPTNGAWAISRHTERRRFIALQRP